MKILHTADWHLGKKLEQFSRLPEQREVLNEICEIVERENPDLILVAGDLYDQINPPVEATELLYQSLKRMAANGRRAVVAIAGNHDSPDRIEVSDPLARACGIIMTGYPHSEVAPFELESGMAVTKSAPGFIELRLPGIEFPVRLILTPYANEIRMRKSLGVEKPEQELRDVLADHWQKLASEYVDNKGVNLLVTHLFMSGSGEMQLEEDEGERSILTVGGAQQIPLSCLPEGLQYVALGHLHGFIPLQKEPFPVVYSSSPLMYSVDDRQQDKQVMLVEVEPDSPTKLTRIPLKKGKPIKRVRFSSIAEALRQLPDYQDSWLVLTIETETHLTAQDRKRLLDAHAGIVQLIPEFTREDLLKFTSGKQVDLNRSMEALFESYFLHKKGVPLNEELRGLFQEILAEEN